MEQIIQIIPDVISSIMLIGILVLIAMWDLVAWGFVMVILGVILRNQEAIVIDIDPALRTELGVFFIVVGAIAVIMGIARGFMEGFTRPNKKA